MCLTQRHGGRDGEKKGKKEKKGEGEKRKEKENNVLIYLLQKIKMKFRVKN